jgi:hypothetical protein
MINKLMIFERKIIRKVFGPTRTDDGYCRIKTNQEIDDLLKGQNIIGFIKKQRLNWLGHVERMIIMCRRLRDENTCLKDQLEGRKHVGRTTFWKI